MMIIGIWLLLLLFITLPRVVVGGWRHADGEGGRSETEEGD